jgi:hypothetical protein
MISRIGSPFPVSSQKIFTPSFSANGMVVPF